KPAHDGFGLGVERRSLHALALFAVEPGPAGFGPFIGAGAGGTRAAVMPPARGFVGGGDRVGVFVVAPFVVEPGPAGLGFFGGAAALGILSRGRKRPHTAQKERAREYQGESLRRESPDLLWWQGAGGGAN